MKIIKGKLSSNYCALCVTEKFYILENIDREQKFT